jgi:hypothetical protein
MRSLALLLILLNLGFLYWHSVHRPPVAEVWPSAKTEIPSGVARLVLLSERSRQLPAPQPLALASPDLHCETVGPLGERDVAEALRTALEERGAVASLRAASREVPSSYWVFLAPRSSREAAQELARALSEQGVRDLYVINEGEYRHGLSLGLFSEHERARRRVAELEALGHGPQIEARFRTQTVYWLDIAVPADRLGDLELPPDLGRMERTCPGEGVRG